jgi:hypothetical protein
MKTLVLTCALLVLPATSVFAQSLDTVTFRVYNVGAPGAIVTTQLSFPGAWACGLAKQTGVNINPNRIVIDDPAAVPAASKDCQWVDNGTGPLLATQIAGSYEGTVQPTNIVAGSTGPEGPRAPFSKQNAPALPALTGLRLYR